MWVAKFWNWNLTEINFISNFYETNIYTKPTTPYNITLLPYKLYVDTQQKYPHPPPPPPPKNVILHYVYGPDLDWFLGDSAFHLTQITSSTRPPPKKEGDTTVRHTDHIYTIRLVPEIC